MLTDFSTFSVKKIRGTIAEKLEFSGDLFQVWVGNPDTAENTLVSGATHRYNKINFHVALRFDRNLQ
jgi:polyisoprenoid-binding protein YceI